MKNFIQDAFNELSHVVWPTRSETRSYFSIVCWALLVSIIALFVVRYGLGEGVFYARNIAQGGDVANASLEGSPINTSTIQATDSEGNPIEGLQVTTSDGEVVIGGEESENENSEAVDGTPDGEEEAENTEEAPETPVVTNEENTEQAEEPVTE